MSRMEQTDADVFAAIIIWAYEHDIEVMLSKHRDYDGSSHPVVRFSRDGSHIEKAFWPLSDTGDYAKQCWREIGMALCVKPPRFKKETAQQAGAQNEKL